MNDKLHRAQRTMPANPALHVLMRKRLSAHRHRFDRVDRRQEVLAVGARDEIGGGAEPEPTKARKATAPSAPATLSKRAVSRACFGALPPVARGPFADATGGMDWDDRLPIGQWERILRGAMGACALDGKRVGPAIRDAASIEGGLEPIDREGLGG